jgi:hypothetical protein
MRLLALFGFWLGAAMVVYLTPVIKMGRLVQSKVIPIIDRLDPVIDSVTIRMLSHHLRLSTNVGLNRRVAKLPSQACQSAIRRR